MKSLIGRFTGLSTVWRVVWGVIVALLLIWAATFVYDLFFGASNTKIKVGENTTEAAIESGKDATQAVGAQAAKEAERAKDIEQLKDKVDEAETANDAHAAGAGWLCDNAGICPED